MLYYGIFDNLCLRVVSMETGVLGATLVTGGEFPISIIEKVNLSRTITSNMFLVTLIISLC